MSEDRNQMPPRPARPEDQTEQMVRRRFAVEFRQPAPAADVSPLLCPTREYDWIDYWRCRVLYSESGVAEDDCVFTTAFEARETWVVTRFDPPERIEFCIFTDAEVVVRLKIGVSDRGDGTSDLRWERIYTATGPVGRDRVRELVTEEVEGRMRDVNERLAYYLENGEMIRRGRFGNGS